MSATVFTKDASTSARLKPKECDGVRSFLDIRLASQLIPSEDVSERLPVKSYIRVHKIFVLEQSLIKGKVSSLNKNKYLELVEKIENIIEL